MKHTVLTGILCLVIGIAIGWIAKPAQPGTEAIAARASKSPPAKSAQAAKPSTSTIAKSSGTSSKSLRPTDSDDVTEAPDVSADYSSPGMNKRFLEMMLKQTKQKSDRKVAELVEKLGLDEAQAAKLQAYFDSKLQLGDSGDSDKDLDTLMQASRELRGTALDTALADILTQDQSLAYEEMKTNERMRKIESSAYKDLAKINTVIDLNDDQKNALYDILYEDAGKKIDKKNSSHSTMAFMMEGHGIDIDLDDVAFGSIAEAAVDSEGNPSPMSQEDIMKSVKENNQRKIDEKVDRLAPVLTPEQLQDYRKHLEAKSDSMFGGIMMEDDADSATSIFVETTESP